LLGKMLAYFVLGLADALIVVLVGVFVFRVPFRGSIPMLLVSACIFLVGALFWGILVSSVARNQVEAYQLGFITSFLPAFLLSGFIYATENMPAIIQAFTRVIPSRYFVTILKGVYLKGSGFGELWTELGLLAVYASVVFLAATRRLNRKVA
jgi:ABC-2 type transport system permease protein